MLWTKKSTGSVKKSVSVFMSVAELRKKVGVA